MKVTYIPATPEEAGAVTSCIRALSGVRHLLSSTGVTLYVHGGGFEKSNPDLEWMMAYRFSRATGRPALRVAYRLAPEHPYPAALDDLLATYRDARRPTASSLPGSPRGRPCCSPPCWCSRKGERRYRRGLSPSRRRATLPSPPPR